MLFKNFRLALLLVFIVFSIYLYKLIYNSKPVAFLSNGPYPLIFFGVTYVLFFALSLRLVIDAIGVFVGQRGQGTVRDKSK